MRRQKKVTQHFLQLSKEHVIIWEHVDKLEKTLQAQPATGAVLELIEALCEDMAEHFAIEEEVLFPAALMGLSDLDVVDDVLTLSKEHGYFEHDFAHLREQLAGMDAAPPLPQEDSVRISHILLSFRQHARLETESLFRQMDESRECGKILKGLIVN